MLMKRNCFSDVVHSWQLFIDSVRGMSEMFSEKSDVKVIKFGVNLVLNLLT